jgi:RNA polymerase sigma-70 factor (ECF subfamily)
MASALKEALLGRFNRGSKQERLTQLSDEALMKEYINGSYTSYELIVERYKERVFKFIYFQVKQQQQDAEDLAQEVFIQLYRKPNNFRVESKFSTYIFAIAKNIVLNHYRTISRRIKSADNSITIDIIDEACMHSNMVNSRQQQEYINAFNQLNIEEQQIIYLADKECFSYLQIGSILDVKIGTVRSRLSAARAKIMNQLRGQLNEM